MEGRWLREGAGVRVLNWVVGVVFLGPVFYGWFLGFLFSRPGTDGLMVWLMGWALSWELWVSGYVPAIGRVTGELAELGLFREMRLARHVYSVMVLQSVVCLVVGVVGLLACCFFRGLRGALLGKFFERNVSTKDKLVGFVVGGVCLIVLVFLLYVLGSTPSDVNDCHRRCGFARHTAFGFTNYAGIMLFIFNACLNVVVLLIVAVFLNKNPRKSNPRL